MRNYKQISVFRMYHSTPRLNVSNYRTAFILLFCHVTYYSTHWCSSDIRRQTEMCSCRVVGKVFSWPL